MRPVWRLRKLAREFGALRFAAGNRGGGLAELHVAQADVHESLQFDAESRNIFQDFQRFFDGQIQEIGDGIGPCSARREFRRCSACRGKLRR